MTDKEYIELWSSLNNKSKNIENNINTLTRKRTGSYYTDIELTDIMMNELVEKIKKSNSAKKLYEFRFLEPCVGSGNFVFSYIKCLNKGGLTKKEALCMLNNIFVADINEEALKGYIEVRFEKENINSLSGDGELMLSILASFAQEESMSISKNVKWGIRKKFEKGKPNGGLNIYGYRWINKQLVIEPDEAKVVKLIYDNYQKGISPETTGKYLTEKGIKAYNGGNFAPSSLRAILTNITYTGDLLLQKDYCPDPIKKGRKRNRGELPQYYVENDHEAIIPMKQFVEIQEEIKRRRELGIRANAAVNTTCFTSKVKCPLCGKSYRRSGKRQSKKKDEICYSWICQTKSKLSSKVCDAKTIPEYELKFASKEVLGLDEFDSDTFDKEIEKVIVIGNDMLEYHFYDGKVVLKEWHSHARTRCWDSKRREEWGEEIKRRWKDGEYDKERKNNTCNS